MHINSQTFPNTYTPNSLQNKKMENTKTEITATERDIKFKMIWWNLFIFVSFRGHRQFDMRKKKTAYIVQLVFSFQPNKQKRFEGISLSRKKYKKNTHTFLEDANERRKFTHKVERKYESK